MRMARKASLALLGGLAFLLACTPARAATFEVVPIRVEFAPGQSTTTVVIRNLGQAPSAVQASGFIWTQADDRDDLAPTDELVISPPIFTIPPQQAQTVRLLLHRNPAAPDRLYRLLFDEVPPASQTSQITIAVRLSIPVIPDQPNTARTPLAWRALRLEDGRLAIAVANPGRRLARLTDVALHLPDGRALALRPLAENPYVLPGAERRWSFPPNAPAPRVAPGTALRLTATAPSGPVEQALAAPP